MMMARFSHRDDDPEATPQPNAMTKNEALFGYSASALVIAASIFVLTVTTGKGAAVHPNRVLPLAGLVLGIAALGSMRLRNRFLACILLILGAAPTNFTKAPNSLRGVQLIALVVPFAFVLVVSQRQRKAQRALGPAARSSQRTPARKKEADGRRRGAPAAPPRRPTGRYTPPKAKRPRR